MKFDHIAIASKKDKLEDTVNWYKEKVKAEILHIDSTWAVLKTYSGLKIAFVVPEQHPPHIGFNITQDQYDKFKEEGYEFKKHRDNSESFYLEDPSGNYIEFLKWPNLN
tara:strand:- start:1185 stop:1511 length:327 start_codon:yes stop_codon:yes gene_type:complete